jgi:indolepyruvate ferredoxin oxidoreductase, alpha subunit
MRKSPSLDVQLLSGDEALARGAFENGIRVAASYPGTPATEIMECLARYPEVNAQWSANEKVAFEVAYGASVAGARSLFSAKHVGVNVAMDPLMTSAYVGANAGFIIVTADDPGIHSSQNEQDNRLFARVAHLPLLEPSSPAESKAFVASAYSLSETYDTPVLIRLTTRISHTKENVAVGDRLPAPEKAFEINIPKYVMVPRNAYLRHIELERRMLRLKAFSEKTPLNRMELNSRKIGFITGSVAYLYAKEMFPDASFLKLGMSYPFPEAKIREFSRKVKEVFVLEELEPFLEEELSRLGIPHKAKHPSYRIGELRPELIPNIVRKKEKEELPPTSRKPVMCPGCPHRPAFWALKKLKAVVTGDIGCYTLGALQPLSSLHTCLCMGTGITFFEGFAKAGVKDVVGVIGDSTFVHSGITGLINAAYNHTKGLIIIMDNATTAMTGNQPHPGTGVTIKGMPTKTLNLEEVCRVAGADHVDVANPLQAKEFEALVKLRMSEDALSVIIARFPCRLLERRRDPMPRYNRQACKKCGVCLQISCPALTALPDKYIEINPQMCTGCALCVSACPFQALEKPNA